MHTYSVPFSAVALVAATAKVVAAIITPATRRGRIIAVELGARSVTQTHAPMLLELVRFTTDGTGTSVTPAPLEVANPAALSTAKKNYSADPTGSPVVVWNNALSPIGNTLIKEIPMTREIYAAVSSVLGFRITAPDNQTVDGALIYEE
jgi:hypothetical protein